MSELPGQSFRALPDIEQSKRVTHDSSTRASPHPAYGSSPSNSGPAQICCWRKWPPLIRPFGAPSPRSRGEGMPARHAASTAFGPSSTTRYTATPPHICPSRELRVVTALRPSTLAAHHPRHPNPACPTTVALAPPARSRLLPPPRSRLSGCGGCGRRRGRGGWSPSTRCRPPT